jgi:hypothetical protein
MTDSPERDETLHDEALRAVAERLGARAAARVDVEHTAQAVVQRLREPVRPLGRRAVPIWLRAAAAVLLVAGGVVLVNRVVRTEHGAPVRALVTEDLSGLSTTELAEVLSTLDQALDSAAMAEVHGLEGLTESQLEALLGSTEG